MYELKEFFWHPQPYVPQWVGYNGRGQFFPNEYGCQGLPMKENEVLVIKTNFHEEDIRIPNIYVLKVGSEECGKVFDHTVRII
jgi:hypothetical protein